MKFPRLRPLNSFIPFFFTTFIVILLLSTSYLPTLAPRDPWLGLFSLSMTLTYAMLYLLPSLVGTALCQLTIGRRQPVIIRGVAVISTTITLLLLLADRIIFQLFHFHLNGFVWNLIITPGGLESMGGGTSTTLTYCGFGLGILSLQTTLLAISLWLYRLNTEAINVMWQRYRTPIFCLFILLATGQALGYGVSSFYNNLSIVRTAAVLPLYQPLTFKGLAKQLGVKPPTRHQVHLKPGEGNLHYPLQPLRLKHNEHPLNIVWLVAESWRFDMLTPEIMPHMSQFSTTTTTFNQHYSGGNGTRMGLFSQFYGLYGAYWFQFLNERQSPVIMDVLQEQNYQLSLHTSAKFSYPEFDKTIFANIPKASLHEYGSGPGWKRDRKNVGELLSFIEQRDPTRPFMTFMFFESPHARYYFPEEDAVRTPYLKDFNYASMSLKKDMPLIFNRYVNACHHLDSQLARVTDYLKQENLLDNTVVIITGDHGEEFLENGYWGHNSEFTEQQVRVPLLLWVPGAEAQEITRMTSHLDLPATILPLIGVENKPETYSQGYNLLGEKHRDYTIISDWSRMAYIDNNVKAIFPVANKNISKSYLTTKEDTPLTESKHFWLSRKKTMLEVLHNLQLFLSSNT